MHRQEYRSGLRYRPPLAIGGHGLNRVPPPAGFDDDPESFPETPGLWRCHHCYVLIADHELDERFYPRPCMGRVAALTAA